MAQNRSGIEEGQKRVSVSDDEWDDNWGLAFSRESKNAPKMKHKRKKREDGETNNTKD